MFLHERISLEKFTLFLFSFAFPVSLCSNRATLLKALDTQLDIHKNHTWFVFVIYLCQAYCYLSILLFKYAHLDLWLRTFKISRSCAIKFGEYQIKSCMYRLHIQILMSFVSSDLENADSVWTHWAAGCLLRYLSLSESFSYSRRKCLNLALYSLGSNREWANQFSKHVKYIESWENLGLHYRYRMWLWRVCSLFPSLSSWFIYWLPGKLVCHVVQIELKPLNFSNCLGYLLSENLRKF